MISLIVIIMMVSNIKKLFIYLLRNFESQNISQLVKVGFDFCTSFDFFLLHHIAKVLKFIQNLDANDIARSSNSNNIDHDNTVNVHNNNGEISGKQALFRILFI